jgi:hypothetical protein
MLPPRSRLRKAVGVICHLFRTRGSTFPMQTSGMSEPVLLGISSVVNIDRVRRTSKYLGELPSSTNS